MSSNKDTAKQWFLTGYKPTQAQFHQVFEWLVWKDEGFDFGDLGDLLLALQNKVDKSVYDAYVKGDRVAYNESGSYTVAAGHLLEKLILLPGSTAEVRIGSSLGTDDLMVDQEVTTSGQVVVLDLLCIESRTIYISGLPIGSHVIFFKRPINLP